MANTIQPDPELTTLLTYPSNPLLTYNITKESSGKATSGEPPTINQRYRGEGHG